MSEFTPRSLSPYPILVRVGLCRDKNCQKFKSYGPVGSQCPGNSKYTTRRSRHFFQMFRTAKEQLNSNKVNLADDIGICEGVSCYKVGYPAAICMECCKRGDPNHFVAVNVQSYTNVFVKNYTRLSKVKNCTELREVKPLESESESDSTINLCESSIGSVSQLDISFDTIIEASTPEE